MTTDTTIQKVVVTRAVIRNVVSRGAAARTVYAGGAQGPAGAAVTGTLISVVWGTPAAESGNAIEVQASCVDYDGSAFVSGLVAVELLVSDGAADNEPSHTAYFTAASTPVGSILAGSGTARAVFQTNSSGLFKIAVHETAAADRYVWVKTGGHQQLFCRARDGVLQLTFT